MIDFGVWQGRLSPVIRPSRLHQAGLLKRSRTPAIRSRQPRAQRRASLIAECLTRGWLAPLWGFEAIACVAGGYRWPSWVVLAPSDVTCTVDFAAV